MRQAQGTPSFLNPFFLLSWAAPIPRAWSAASVAWCEHLEVPPGQGHVPVAVFPEEHCGSVLMGDGNEHPISLFAEPTWKSSPMGRRPSAAPALPWMGSLRVYEMTF